MKACADTSFLVQIYLTQVDSPKALAFLRDYRDPLPYTPLHRHELRNALRLAVFRKIIDADRCKAAFADIEADLTDGILAHVPVPWTNAFRAADKLADIHAETLGVRAMDLLHVGLALTLGTEMFLTFDGKQKELAAVAGLKTGP